MPKQLQKYNLCFVEKEVGLRHYCSYGAPSDWAKERGATHTLETSATGSPKLRVKFIDMPKANPFFTLRHGNTRPAQIYKTFALIGVDETDTGDIVWERWAIKIV